MQAAFEDEENQEVLASAFDDSVEVAIIEEGGDGLIKKNLKALNKGSITDKEFYKAMQKLKDRGANAVPPKKSASAYIIFGKEVSQAIYRGSPRILYCQPLIFTNSLSLFVETSRDPQKEPNG